MPKNPLRTILGVLVVAPQPLSPLEVGVVCGLTREDARHALLVLEACDMVREVKPGRYEPLTTREVIAEAVSAARFQHRERELRRLSDSLESAVAEALEIRTTPSAPRASSAASRPALESRTSTAA